MRDGISMRATSTALGHDRAAQDLLAPLVGGRGCYLQVQAEDSTQDRPPLHAHALVWGWQNCAIEPAIEGHTVSMRQVETRDQCIHSKQCHSQYIMHTLCLGNLPMVYKTPHASPFNLTNLTSDNFVHEPAV